METIGNQKVKGRYASPLSIKPLKEANLLGSKMETYLDGLRKKHKASVFKIHAGLKTVVCLDHVSATFYFNAPESVLAREDKPRFGSLVVRPEIIRTACPTLVATGEKHTSARLFTDEILKYRAQYLEPSFDKVSENVLKKWQSSTNHQLWDLLIDYSSNITCNWLFDLDIEMEKAKLWLNNSCTLDTDSTLSQLLGKVVLPKCPRKMIAIQEEMRSLIEQSPLFKDYLAMAKLHDVSQKDLSDFLIFLGWFNGTGAPTFSLYHALIRTYSTPELKNKLKKELKGASKDEILNNPLLDNVFHEFMRQNAVPRIYYKKAQCDFVMPAAEGKSYAIKKGDLILIPANFPHTDPTVFKNPKDFDPYRFERNPELKEKVFVYGTTNQSKNSYGCAANKTGQAIWVWKNMFAKFISHIEFDFAEKPIFNFNSISNFYPQSIKMINVSIDGTQNTAIRKSDHAALCIKFEEMANKVRNRDIEFNKKQYLKLYGLYKQVWSGDNNIDPPSKLKVLATEKWINWNRLKGMSATEAMGHYIQITTGKKHSFTTNAVLPNSQKEETPEKELLKADYKPNTTGVTTKAHFLIDADTPDLGSDLDLELILYGTKEKSNPITVHIPQNISSQHIKWALDIPFVGKPEVIYLSCKSVDENDMGSWLLKSVEVRIENVDVAYKFIHNSYIAIPSVQNILFETSGCLPQNESDIQQKAGKLYLEQKKKLYNWNTNDVPYGQARFTEYGELPLEEQFQEKSISSKTADSYDNVEKPTSFDYYIDKVNELNETRKAPRVAKDGLWMKDEEFGRLYTQGTHCNFFKLCTNLPEELNLKNDFLIAKAGKTLQELINQKLVYICDYEILKNAKPSKGYHIAAPIVLFYSEVSTKNLLPIVIQIDRDPEALIYTPEDEFNDWLIAKMWARVADISVHQLHSHFSLTHGVTEAFILSAQHTFTPAHPIYQLLLPHFKFTICINTIARTALLNKGGWIDLFFSFGGEVQERVMKKSCENYSHKEYMNFKRDLKKRGVEDNASLPLYPYRDDGLLIWGCIEKYVKNILSIYYKNDTDVQEDYALEEWLNEFKNKGFSNSDWKKVSSLNELEDLLTSLLFTVTALHGSMNILQYEIYGFIPFSPSAMLKPPPIAKGITSTQNILDTLPGCQMLQIYLFLSQSFKEDIKIGANKYIYSSNSNFRFEELQFRIELEKIEEIINERNKDRVVPYISMLPSHIPNSIDL